jgi:hypothetical protein
MNNDRIKSKGIDYDNLKNSKSLDTKRQIKKLNWSVGFSLIDS